MLFMKATEESKEHLRQLSLNTVEDQTLPTDAEATAAHWGNNIDGLQNHSKLGSWLNNCWALLPSVKELLGKN